MPTPAPLPRSSKRTRILFLGPAFVAAIGYIDPGNYATNIQAGADYGYLLLWVVVWANLMAALIQMLSAKLGLATGESLASQLGKRLPRWAVYPYWIQAEILAMATDIAEFVGAALGFKLLFGFTLMEGAIITAIISWAVLSLETRNLKTLQIVIGGMLLSVALIYVVELLFSHPHPASVLEGALIPGFDGRDSVFLAAGILGATVMPHVIYLHSALSKADLVKYGKLHRKTMFRSTKWDVAIAMTIAGFVNLSMLAMAAAVFYGNPSAESGSIENAYVTLSPLLGEIAAQIFGASLLIAGLASTIVGTLAGQEIMNGFVRFRIPLWLRRAITMTPSFIIIALGLNVTEVLVYSQVVLSFGIALALIPLVLFTSDRKLMRGYVNPTWVRWLGWLTVVVVVSLNGYLLATS
ncbi:Nramp family divalent metal transporter [Halothiobacillus sp.]|uniref:Nramp family divalent metal transporter n=1 Tax=Halothiobacillus sp. TaxID=1891311 RepID=UPI00261BAD33|nr:Nramp family divalent metal transporter [Halothiobacillus sp.]MDD3576981.1 Nramp family divalent metal transporter [Halothiobacillus sp.]MDD4966049.1 Nramp family divalent metal transporter [Halothiobacillus sp.]